MNLASKEFNQLTVFVLSVTKRALELLMSLIPNAANGTATGDDNSELLLLLLRNYR
jgi:hypothetical protein